MLHEMLDQASYMAHGYCLLWKPWLVALHAGSDFLIFAAYFAIPIAIWIFVSKRPNVELKSMALMFAAFILWCGLTHIINLVTLWVPVYEFQGWVKAITAVISVTTAVSIFPLIPRALAIPSPNELQLANRKLALEVAAHQATLAALEKTRDELEARVKARTRELEEITTRFRLLFERAPVAMLMCDDKGDIRQMNTQAERLFGYPASELTGAPVETLMPARHRTVHKGLRADYVKAATVRAMGPGRELSARTKDGQEFPVEVGLNPMEVEGHTFVVASVVDISERRQREEQIKMLLREVNHRSKNMLGVVQSIARYTAAGDGAEFAQRFSERVRALGASQDLLINSDWRGAEMAQLVRSQIEHFKDLIGTRIQMHGPALRLSPAAAQTIGMALHELATNAGKYGALSGSGVIVIEWRVLDDRLLVSWLERGGPRVTTPSRRGFGMTVIESLTKMGLSGEVHLDFAPEGLSWRLDCPSERVLDRHQQIEQHA
jgi:PAS domain S-box-containing protein